MDTSIQHILYSLWYIPDRLSKDDTCLQQMLLSAGINAITKQWHEKNCPSAGLSVNIVKYFHVLEQRTYSIRLLKESGENSGENCVFTQLMRQIFGNDCSLSYFKSGKFALIYWTLRDICSHPFLFTVLIMWKMFMNGKFKKMKKKTDRWGKYKDCSHSGSVAVGAEFCH